MKKKKVKPIKHIHKEGSRTHVIYWDTNGRHCSEEDCEINFENNIKTIKDWYRYNNWLLCANQE